MSRSCAADVTEPARSAVGRRGLRRRVPPRRGAQGTARAGPLPRQRRRHPQPLLAAAVARRARLARSSMSPASPRQGPAREAARRAPKTCRSRPLTWYGHSKLAGENAVRASRAISIWTIVRPSIVFGPRERDVLGYFRIARRGCPAGGRILRPLLLADLRRRTSPRACSRAAEAPAAAGQVYFLAGTRGRQLGRARPLIATALGVAAGPCACPSSVAAAAGRNRRLARARARPPRIFSSQKVIEMLAPAWVCSAEKAARDFGWRATTPLPDALAADGALVPRAWLALTRRACPFGLNGTLGAFRPPRRRLAGYLILASVPLTLGAARGAPGARSSFAGEPRAARRPCACLHPVAAGRGGGFWCCCVCLWAAAIHAVCIGRPRRSGRCSTSSLSTRGWFGSSSCSGAASLRSCSPSMCPGDGYRSFSAPRTTRTTSSCRNAVHRPAHARLCGSRTRRLHHDASVSPSATRCSGCSPRSARTTGSRRTLALSCIKAMSSTICCSCSPSAAKCRRARSRRPTSPSRRADDPGSPLRAAIVPVHACRHAADVAGRGLPEGALRHRRSRWNPDGAAHDCDRGPHSARVEESLERGRVDLTTDYRVG